jgi:hypothetical protein
MNSEPRKTDSWVNAIKKSRTLASGRRQSHGNLTEKKYILSGCATWYNKAAHEPSMYLVKNNLSVKLRCLEVPEACISSTAKDVGFVL